MAKLIFISPYLKGNKDSAHLAHRARYFAIREGVQLLKDDNSDRPVTQKQEQYIQRLFRSFPEAKELAEYEDYRQTPNRQTAFELIEQIHEDFIEPMDSRENYLDYISNRPGVKALGEHGLWDIHGKVESLEKAVEEVAQHQGNVWTPIISLTRENAERLGYTDVENWQALIAANLSAIAKGYKIKPDNLRWYAALHEKEKHIHVHMIIFSSNPKEGYLTRQGIRDVKSAFVRTAYRNERMHIYEQKSNQRNLLQQEVEGRMEKLIAQMATGTIQNTKLELLTAELAQRLRECSGKKVYGYLPPRVKRIVDEIVDELAKDERVAEAYDLWQTLREQLCLDYNETLPERVSLSQQRDFKTVRNMVIRETLKLCEMTFTFDDESMPDEETEENEPIPDREENHSFGTVYEQAKSYCQAKELLYNLDADPAEKGKAMVTLCRLWDEGYSIAAHLLGKVYRDGLGVPADPKQAMDWFRKSAEAGNDCSAYTLGKLLQELGQNKASVLWYERANNKYAQYRLGMLLLSGAEGVPKDTEKAVGHLTASAESGYQYAQYALGKLYLLGREVKQDREEGLEWLNLAAAQGNTYAQFFVDRQDDFATASVWGAVLRMLHQMSRIFRENSAQPAIYKSMKIDKKRRYELQHKRLAMGHKADDYDDSGLTTQL